MTSKPIQIQSWQLKAVILSTVFATIGYLAFSVWGGWQEVTDAFVQIGLVGTLIALTLSLINYGLRFWRWQLYLSKLGHQLPWWTSLKIYLAGFALTTTPGKAGEAIRGLLLKQHGVSYPSSFAALLSERLSDLLAVVFLALLGLSQYQDAQNIVLGSAACVVLAMAVISNKRALDFSRRFTQNKSTRFFKLATHSIDILAQARQCYTFRLLFVSTGMSVIAWGSEALALYWVLEWLGADISVTFAVFIYAVSMLAGALSFLPGGLGGAEAAMISLLVLKGMAMPQAIAATVFIRLATLWFAVLIGLFALISARKGVAS